MRHRGTAAEVSGEQTHAFSTPYEKTSPSKEDGGGEASSRTGRAQRRRCLPCAPPGGRIGEGTGAASVRARVPRRRGAGTWPGSPAARGGCPAVALYQRLHRPVRGRLRRQAYLVDHSCASRCCPLHTPRQGQAAAARGSAGGRVLEDRSPVWKGARAPCYAYAETRPCEAQRDRVPDAPHRPMAQGASRAEAWRDDARHALRPVLHGGPPPGRRRRLTPAPAGSLARRPALGAILFAPEEGDPEEGARVEDCCAGPWVPYSESSWTNRAIQTRWKWPQAP